MGKLIESTSYTQISTDTGEILEKRESNVFRLKQEDNYVKLYVKDITYLIGLQGNQYEILYSILQNMNYGNLIVLNSFIKDAIAKELNIKTNTINKAITLFVKTQILFREGRGTYRANPWLFGKGDWRDIEKMRAEVTWTPNGKTIKTIIDCAKQTDVVVASNE